MKIKELTFVVFDFEATYNSSIGYHEIIEIGACKLEKGTLKVIDSFSTLVKPSSSIITPIVLKTGITDLMVKNSPTIEQIWEQFWIFCQNSVMVGHQVGFDKGVIEKTTNNKNLKKINAVFLDTLGFTKKLYPNEDSYSLDNLSKKYNVENTANHRAIGDALTTAYIFQAIMNEMQSTFGYDTIEQIDDFLNKKDPRQTSLF